MELSRSSPRRTRDLHQGVIHRIDQGVERDAVPTRQREVRDGARLEHRLAPDEVVPPQVLVRIRRRTATSSSRYACFCSSVRSRSKPSYPSFGSRPPHGGGPHPPENDFRRPPRTRPVCARHPGGGRELGPPAWHGPPTSGPSSQSNPEPPQRVEQRLIGPLRVARGSRCPRSGRRSPSRTGGWAQLNKAVRTRPTWGPGGRRRSDANVRGGHGDHPSDDPAPTPGEADRPRINQVLVGAAGAWIHGVPESRRPAVASGNTPDVGRPGDRAGLPAPGLPVHCGPRSPPDLHRPRRRRPRPEIRRSWSASWARSGSSRYARCAHGTGAGGPHRRSAGTPGLLASAPAPASPRRSRPPPSTGHGCRPR